MASLCIVAIDFFFVPGPVLRVLIARPLLVSRHSKRLTGNIWLIGLEPKSAGIVAIIGKVWLVRHFFALIVGRLFLERLACFAISSCLSKGSSEKALALLAEPSRRADL